MKLQIANFKFQNIGIVALFLLLLAHCLPLNAFASEEKWPGVDKAVVENIAKEHGREINKPLINTDQGDLLLFVFLLAGAAGGFTAGYYWRILLEKRKDK